MRAIQLIFAPMLLACVSAFAQADMPAKMQGQFASSTGRKSDWARNRALVVQKKSRSNDTIGLRKTAENKGAPS